MVRATKGTKMARFRATNSSTLALTLACLVGCTASEGRQVTGHEPIVGGPCERCEAVFQGLPADLSVVARIAPRGEPGEPMRIVGKVMHPDGTAASGTIVYAYHRNAEGIYPENERFRGRAAYRHGMLRGWVKADEDGRYRLDTVRPAGYPDSDLPQHIHMHVIEPGRCTYYIDDIVFKDDPRLTPDKLDQYTHGRGGTGVVTPRRDQGGIWLVERDIILGEGIPDYPTRAQQGDAADDATRRR